jgi:membrane protein involved in colicin uptake
MPLASLKEAAAVAIRSYRGSSTHTVRSSPGGDVVVVGRVVGAVVVDEGGAVSMHEASRRARSSAANRLKVIP